MRSDLPGDCHKPVGKGCGGMLSKGSAGRLTECRQKNK
jgi:hypothetical protein